MPMILAFTYDLLLFHGQIKDLSIFAFNTHTHTHVHCSIITRTTDNQSKALSCRCDSYFCSSCTERRLFFPQYALHVKGLIAITHTQMKDAYLLFVPVIIDSGRAVNGPLFNLKVRKKNKKNKETEHIMHFLYFFSIQKRQDMLIQTRIAMV